MASSHPIADSNYVDMILREGSSILAHLYPRGSNIHRARVIPKTAQFWEGAHGTDQAFVINVDSRGIGMTNIVGMLYHWLRLKRYCLRLGFAPCSDL